MYWSSKDTRFMSKILLLYLLFVLYVISIKWCIITFINL